MKNKHIGSSFESFLKEEGLDSSMEKNMGTIKSDKYPCNKDSKELNEIFFCECFSEGLMLSKYPEDRQISIGFFQLGFYNKNKLSLKERLRWMWHILTTGMPYTDMVMLNDKNALDLAKTITNFVNSKG